MCVHLKTLNLSEFPIYILRLGTYFPETLSMVILLQSTCLDFRCPSLKCMLFYPTSYQDNEDEDSTLPRYQDRPSSLATLCTSLHSTCPHSITLTLPVTPWCSWRIMIVGRWFSDCMGGYIEESCMVYLSAFFDQKAGFSLCGYHIYLLRFRPKYFTMLTMST